MRLFIEIFYLIRFDSIYFNFDDTKNKVENIKLDDKLTIEKPHCSDDILYNSTELPFQPLSLLSICQGYSKLLIICSNNGIQISVVVEAGISLF